LRPLGVVRPPSSASPTSKASPLKPTTKYIFRTFDVPGAGTGPGQGTVPAGILPDGTIGGGYYDSNGALHSWVRTPNGTITILADAPGAGAFQGSVLHGMNSAGAITGPMAERYGSRFPAFSRWHLHCVRRSRSRPRQPKPFLDRHPSL
jgi:hypothetical protein